MTYREFMQEHYPTITLLPPDPVVNEIVPHGTISTPHIEDCESLQDTSFNLLLDSHPDSMFESSYEYIIDDFEGYNLEDFIF